MLGHLLTPELEELIHGKRWDVLRDAISQFHPSDIAEILVEVPAEDDVALFRVLPRQLAGRVFSHLPASHQQELVKSISSDQMRVLLSEMTPDDQTRFLEELPPEVTRRVLETLSPEERKAARDLLGYAPETAGRFMTPAYVTLHPEMTARDALDHIRQRAREVETLNVLYVVDQEGRLLEDIRLGTLVMAPPEARVGQLYDGKTVTLVSSTPLDEVLRTFEKYDRIALPVIDAEGQMLGIITIDDVLDVAQRQSTEDIQKIGGSEALDGPYLDVSYSQMLKKRGGWLSVLFLGEMLTASAMGHFEDELAAAPVLMMFVPLIISSGGNSGSQAATILVRSLALTEVRLRDWFVVLWRELRTSATLGLWLGLLGFARIAVWQHLGLVDYGVHHALVGASVWLSLVGVVMFGSVAGSMLPFLLRSLGFNPATGSAPLVATLVDVTGLVIYFTVAMYVLRGTLL